MARETVVARAASRLFLPSLVFPTFFVWHNSGVLLPYILYFTKQGVDINDELNAAS